MGRKYRVELVFEGKTIEVGEEENLLSACEKEGIKLDFNCREGACTTCAGKLRSGEVEQLEALAITDDQKRQGYCLTCVARPKSDLVLETGVMGELEQ
ncbi:MAG: 2Fe-2S iron-sulfur cluster binding domain-containing protein [Euryarchaeota archaeon]|nr:2Fe-2S iron-sulfur cluster binding domain-containing protein [Euryarchaeota archaeon]